jgi:hypothetical protein
LRRNWSENAWAFSAGSLPAWREYLRSASLAAEFQPPGTTGVNLGFCAVRHKSRCKQKDRLLVALPLRKLGRLHFGRHALKLIAPTLGSLSRNAYGRRAN